AALVDQDQIDTWVAHWGGWLAALSFEPGLVGVCVTIETAPDTGQRLRTAVGAKLSREAPKLARAMLTEVVETYPAGSARVLTRIAVTYSSQIAGLSRRKAQSGQRRRSAEMGRFIATRMPGLAAGLAMTGAGPARAMTAQELTVATRVAYDPGSQ